MVTRSMRQRYRLKFESATSISTTTRSKELSGRLKNALAFNIILKAVLAREMHESYLITSLEAWSVHERTDRQTHYIFHVGSISRRSCRRQKRFLRRIRCDGRREPGLRNAHDAISGVVSLYTSTDWYRNHACVLRASV